MAEFTFSELRNTTAKDDEFQEPGEKLEKIDKEKGKETDKELQNEHQSQERAPLLRRIIYSTAFLACGLIFAYGLQMYGGR